MTLTDNYHAVVVYNDPTRPAEYVECYRIEGNVMRLSDAFVTEMRRIPFDTVKSVIPAKVIHTDGYKDYAELTPRDLEQIEALLDEDGIIEDHRFADRARKKKAKRARKADKQARKAERKAALEAEKAELRERLEAKHEKRAAKGGLRKRLFGSRAEK